MAQKSPMHPNTSKSKNTTGLLNWLVRCNTFDPSQFLYFTIDDVVVGNIHQSRVPLLGHHANVFQVFPEYVTLHPRLDTVESRTEAVEEVLQQWRKDGLITGWRDEKYRVSRSFDTPPLMLIERSVASLFGILNYGVHVNGLTTRDGVLHMWIARRSAQKPTYPGCLDHIVAGGLSAGMEAQEILIKECQEEANIPPELGQQARPVGTISFCMDDEQRLKRDIIFIYDLQLPEHFVPENSDGEVDEFYLWPIEKVMETTATTQQIKTNCNLVMIDFLVRYGYLCPEDSYYLEIVQKLRSPV